jgi:hypothetical protein
MRRCAKCGVEKPPTDFYKGRNADGLHSYCKACRLEEAA